ncbi:MAG: family 16 glycoside hydrolase, partial [Thermoleophilia bacterium]
KLSTTTAAGTPLAATATATYDELGNKLTSTDALGNVTRYVSGASGVVSTFDNLGFITSTLSSIGQDNLSQSGSIDSRGYIAVDKSNASGVVSTTNQLSSTVTNSYSAGGSLAARVDAGFSPYKFSYDALGRPANYQDPFGGSTTFAYDSLGNLALRTDARGMTQAYTYDNAGHLLSRADSSPSGAPAKYTYSTAGQLTSMANSGGGSYVSYSYDPSGKLAQATYTDFSGAQTQAQYGYSSNGSLASVSDQSGGYTSYTYDAQGRLSSLSSSSFGSTTPALTVSYDANGNVTKQTGPDGTTTSFTYDQAGHQTSQATYNSSGTLLSGQAYTYDQSANRTSSADLRWQDSFNSGSLSNWSSVSGAAWSESDGTVTVNSATDTILTRDAQPNTDYAFQANIKMIQNRDVGLVFRYQDDKDYYMVRASGFSGDGAQTTLWKYSGGSPYLLASFPMAATPAMGSWYTIRVQVQGAAIFWSYQVGGYLSPVFYAADSSYSGGKVGLKAGPGGGTNQDQFAGAILSAVPTVYTYDAAGELTQVQNPDRSTISYTYDKNGNRLTSSASALFADNFSGSSIDPNWVQTPSQPPNYYLDSSLGAQALKGTSPGSDALITRSTSGNNDYTYQASIYENSGQDVGLIVRYQDADDYYLVRCSGQDPGQVTLWKKQNGGWGSALASYGTSILPAVGSWYTVRATVKGNAISWSYQVNGSWSPTYTYTDTSSSPYLTGGVGFRIGGGANTDHFTGVSVLSAVTYSYDAANQLTQVKDSAGNVAASLTYDASGNTVSNGTSYYLYDERNQLTDASATNGTDGSVQYTYDALGSLYSRSTRPLIFSDDFSAGLGSWSNAAANWSNPTDTGNLVAQANGAAGAVAIWRAPGSPAANDYIFSAKVKVLSSNAVTGTAGLVVRSDAATNGQDHNEYYFGIYPGQGVWKLWKVISSNFGASPVATGAMTFGLNKYYSLGARATGNSISYWINGARVTTYTDQSSPYLSGSLGLRARNVTADFDDVRVESPVAGAATYYRYNEVTGALQAELDSSGNVTAAYVTGPGGGPISVTRGGKTYFYHTNAHGDVTAITGAGGNLLASFTYDAWGVPTELTAQGQSVPIGTWAGSPGEGLFFLFGGMLYDAATGLYLTKSRVYDPKTGRFLSRDILDETGKNGVYKGFPFGRDAIGTNLYAWCGNSPESRSDPSGRAWMWDDYGYCYEAHDWVDTSHMEYSC